MTLRYSTAGSRPPPSPSSIQGWERQTLAVGVQRPCGFETNSFNPWPRSLLKRATSAVDVVDKQFAEVKDIDATAIEGPRKNQVSNSGPVGIQMAPSQPSQCQHSGVRVDAPTQASRGAWERTQPAQSSNRCEHPPLPKTPTPAITPQLTNAPWPRQRVGYTESESQEFSASPTAAAAAASAAACLPSPTSVVTEEGAATGAARRRWQSQVATAPLPPAESQMLEITGVRVAVVREVPCSRRSLHSSTVAVVWTKDAHILQWNGAESSSVLRVKGLQLCSGFKDSEHGSRARITRVEEGEEPPDFWSALAEAQPPAGEAPAGARHTVRRDLAAEEELVLRRTVLVEFDPAKGGVGVPIPTSGVLRRSLLRGDCSYALKAPGRRAHVWVGGGCPRRCADAALEFARGDERMAVKEPWIRRDPAVEREAGEGTLFRTLFADWLTSCGTQAKMVDKSDLPLVLDSAQLARRAGATLVTPQNGNGQPDTELSLYHIKGRKLVTVQRVPVSIDSLNNNDVFILTTKKCIYQWNGASSNPMERSKAAEFVACLRERQFCGRVCTFVMEESDGGSQESDEFFQKISGRAHTEVLRQEAETDDKHEEDARAGISLVMVTAPNPTQEGSRTIEELGLAVSAVRRPYRMQSLHDDDACVLAWQHKQLYVWTGACATVDAKQRAWKYAAYVQSSWSGVKVAIEHAPQHGEPPLFCAHLLGYSSQAKAVSRQPAVNSPTKIHYAVSPSTPEKRASPGKDKSTLILESRAALVDVEEVEASCPLIDELLTPAIKHDDGSTGRLRLWRVTNGRILEMSGFRKPLLLSSTECYVQLYTFCPGVDMKVVRHIIYAWQGQLSKKQDIALSAMSMTDVSKQISEPGMIDKQTIAEGKETEHFLVVAGGLLITSLLSTAEEQNTARIPARLFDVRTAEFTRGKAVEVAPQASALFSGACFVLLVSAGTSTQRAGTRSVVWRGHSCADDDLSLALKTYVRIEGQGQQPPVVEEGREPEWFWEALGGKGGYVRIERARVTILNLTGFAMRLFYLEMAGNLVRPREVTAPCRADLSNTPAGACLVDHIFSGTVFLWHNGRCTPHHLKECYEMTRRYIQARARRLAANLSPEPVVEVEGRESSFFSACFQGWGRVRVAIG